MALKERYGGIVEREAKDTSNWEAVIEGPLA